VSIGDTLAEARRQAGLTMTQVSRQTRIRESIISAIERGDFSSCGGDFYARGHIRSSASAVGAEPAALIRDYDEEHAPGALRAAQIFESATPIRIREPRRLRLGWVFAVFALLAVAGFVSYHVLVTHAPSPAATATSRVRHIAKPTPKTHVTAKPTVTHPAAGPQAVIRLTASQDCWVKLSASSGQSIYEGMILAGSSMTWHERHAVSMVIGNPAGIGLTVNGRTQPMNTVRVVRLSIDPRSKSPVTVS
jgi:cytoskeletal protein RodZ